MREPTALCAIFIAVFRFRFRRAAGKLIQESLFSVRYRIDKSGRIARIPLRCRIQIFIMTTSSTSKSTLQQTYWPELRLHAKGKVRDIYDLDGQLLFIATDRISAVDYVLATGIPEKGRVLTQISLFWFEFLKDTVRGRYMLVKKAKMVDIECVARGYISGSAWKEYQQHGTVCGIALPQGLR